MLHYHGTPITPRAKLLRMQGRNFCVSFAAPADLKTCLNIGQCLMFDNGAFSTFTRGLPFDEAGFYRWIEPHLGHPHWAVVPDVIGGDEAQQLEMMARWPFRKELGLPVWHLGLSLDHLRKLADEWPRVCFGSSEEYWQVGSDSWCNRMDEAFNVLSRRGPLPWVHGLRMLGMAGMRWPLASADSTNIAQNHHLRGCPECMAERIDAIQCPVQWTEHATQGVLL